MLKNEKSNRLPSIESEVSIEKIPHELEGRQIELYKILKEHDEGYAKYYMGALLVLNQYENVDRVALAAHGIRELIEKFPKIFDIKIGQQILGDKVKKLHNTWKDNKDSNTCKESIDEFFQWYENSNVSRKNGFKKFLTKINGSIINLPDIIEMKNTEELLKLDRYFTKVAHHSRTNDEEFSEKLRNLEKLLFIRLKPETIKDFSVIDTLIAEGERND